MGYFPKNRIQYIQRQSGDIVLMGDVYVCTTGIISIVHTEKPTWRRMLLQVGHGLVWYSMAKMRCKAHFGKIVWSEIGDNDTAYYLIHRFR